MFAIQFLKTHQTKFISTQDDEYLERRNILGIYLIVLFGGVILLAIFLSRDSRTKHSTHPSHKVGRDSITEKIHHSLVEENMMFDGESQEYADAMSKRRASGW